MPEHWLSYSNADQSILREDTRGLFWDGLVVPGTLATYYKQGVGGYVLSRRKPFVIDPRTPLLQPVTINRVLPRASHETLAAIHDLEVANVWAAGREVELGWWTADRWRAAVDSVLDFETNFEREAADKVAKYDAMLSEVGLSLDQPIAGPDRLIPPYWAVTGVGDPWWTLSLSAIQRATSRTQRVMPVLCLSPPASPALFGELIDQLPTEITEVFCWLGRWDESDATAADVAGWIQTSARGAAHGINVLNMYGGALSVYLTGLGLAGVSHGVGYSESRDERRLGQTGAPPIRYYLPRLRTFLPVPQAQQALDRLGSAWHCGCPVCSPNRGVVMTLDGDNLKRHFLLTRATEFHEAEDTAVVVENLDRDGSELQERFYDPERPDELAERGAVLQAWSSALAAQLAE